ncbi:hypothetical protein T229_10975 [Tannerella sp. oral taxon BU063 isolate Cell 5]|uniref:Uncharacterized protein n=1 Tax=Tannerella sp. oral taxon BU063 isolate Cell 5 TaxID=1410950 RepID=W2C9Z6_9BACT|nr:hypothetical protein T229_10975 [Tannerella sp. oral taxon BU063 isolate Cell 5]
MAFKVFDTDSLKFFTEADKVREYVGDACKEMIKPACFFFVAGCKDTPSKGVDFNYTWSYWDNLENYSELASVIVQALFSPRNEDLLRSTIQALIERADTQILKEIRRMADTRISAEGEQ